MDQIHSYIFLGCLTVSNIMSFLWQILIAIYVADNSYLWCDCMLLVNFTKF
jgi:hypothetical protein